MPVKAAKVTNDGLYEQNGTHTVSTDEMRAFRRPSGSHPTKRCGRIRSRGGSSNTPGMERQR